MTHVMLAIPYVWTHMLCLLFRHFDENGSACYSRLTVSQVRVGVHAYLLSNGGFAHPSRAKSGRVSELLT